MKQKIKLIPRILAFVLVVIMLAVTFVGCGNNNDYREIDALIDKIQQEYYQDIDKQTLIEAAIKGMFTELDPYSMAYTYEEYVAIAASNAGQGKNFGFSIRTLPRRPVSVARVTGGSPAEDVGMKVGDEIVGIKYEGESEYQSVEYLTQNELIEKLTNPNKPKYSLRVQRVKTDKFDVLNGKTAAELFAALNDPSLELFETKDLPQMEQKAYNIKYVYYYMSGEHTNITDTGLISGLDSLLDASEVGYIRLTEFSGKDTVKDFGDAMDKFKAAGKKRLILDLRDNPGGNTDVLGGVASYLVYNEAKPAQNLIPIFVAKYKSGKTARYYTTASRYKEYFGDFVRTDKKITVLVNGMSASASEALSSAILDYGTGVLVGTTTYKKGIMQTTYDMTNLNYFLKVTVATFYSPVTDVTLHGVGLTPTGGNYLEDNYYGFESNRQLNKDSQFLRALGLFNS